MDTSSQGIRRQSEYEKRCCGLAGSIRLLATRDTGIGARKGTTAEAPGTRADTRARGYHDDVFLVQDSV
jgi:hypothetical protein